MRIIERYLYDVTRMMDYSALLEQTVAFLQQEGLSYADERFCIAGYKSKKLRRRHRYEQIASTDPFWAPYLIQAPGKHSPDDYDEIGLTNLVQDGWDLRPHLPDPFPGEAAAKLREIAPQLRNDNMAFAFCGVNWHGVEPPAGAMTASAVSRLQPLSAGITLRHEGYSGRSYAVLQFERQWAEEDPLYYVKAFSATVGQVTPVKEVDFVRADTDFIPSAEQQAKIADLCRTVEALPFAHQPPAKGILRSLQITKTLRGYFPDYALRNEGNGVYTLQRTDGYGNLISVFFDYDRHAVMALISYQGMGFRYLVHLPEWKSVDDEEILAAYAAAVRARVEDCEAQLTPQIAACYPAPPHWFSWE